LQFGIGTAICAGIVFQGLAGNLERYMTLLSDRQKLVASNIANADTPGYQTQDIDFRAEFSRQMDDTAPHILEPDGLPVKPDGNNVSLDRESRLLAENAMRFSVASNLVRSKFNAVRAAIEDGKSS
jgi:flagellar basal-body rod protein FlgB